MTKISNSNSKNLTSDSLFVMARHRIIRTLLTTFEYNSIICALVVSDVIGMYAGIAS